MARDGITFEQVVAAADALLGGGQQPTIKAVREKLGTGSPNTVHRHLTTWRASRPQAVTAAPVLPASLTTAIAAEIERAAAQARSEIESRLVQAQSESADLSAAGEAMEAERDALVEQVTALTSERDTLAGKAAQQAEDMAKQVQIIEREQQAANAANVELAKSQLRAEAQSGAVQTQATEIERLRVTLDAESKARIAAEQQAAVLAAKLEAMTDRTTKSEARSELIEQQAKQSLQELATARVQVQAQQSGLDTAAREIAAATATVKEARAEAKKSGEEAAELRGATSAHASKAASVAKKP